MLLNGFTGALFLTKPGAYGAGWGRLWASFTAL